MNSLLHIQKAWEELRISPLLLDKKICSTAGFGSSFQAKTKVEEREGPTNWTTSDIDIIVGQWIYTKVSIFSF